MDNIGFILQPDVKGLALKTEFFGIRFNHSKAFMSNTVLGLQVLIDFLGDLMWINIYPHWIVSERRHK